MKEELIQDLINLFKKYRGSSDSQVNQCLCVLLTICGSLISGHSIADIVKVVVKQSEKAIEQITQARVAYLNSLIKL